MPSRRQQKVARVIMESVSDTIANRLNDPRIEGIVSVTKVDVSPDMHNADVYLSIMGGDEKSCHRTFTAIEHASRHIQTLLGHKMTSKYCPCLHFYKDEQFKKTLETFKLIEQAAKEYRDKDAQEDSDIDQE